MANTKRSSSPEEQEIIAGQNEINRLPKDLRERSKLLDNEKATREQMNDKIAQVKADAGLAAIERNLTESWGYTPQAIKINRILDGMPARSRAATIRQINLRAEDKAWVLPDMFDQAASADRGVQAEEPVQQRTPEEMANSHGVAPDGKTSSEEARKALDAYNAEHPKKGGRQPNERIRLEKELEEAVAREGGPAPSNVVEMAIHKQLREGAAEGDAHIRQQIEREAAKDSAKESAKAEPEKTKAGRGKKDKAADSKPAETKAAPLADDDEEEAPAAPQPPSGIGTVGASFRMN